MNVLMRAYLVAGFAFILGVYSVMLGVWFYATLNGAVNGQYVVTIYTDSLGESDVLLLLLFAFLPAMAWVFTKGIRQAMRQETSG